MTIRRYERTYGEVLSDRVRIAVVQKALRMMTLDARLLTYPLVREEMVEYENGDGGLVNVNFEVADVTKSLVAVGEFQQRGMTVVMGPHGSFVTRGQVMKPFGSNLDLEHSDGAYWIRLRR